jgi:hypothetical protein
MLPGKRFRQKSRSDSQIVYADNPFRRIGAIIILIVWALMTVYLAYLALDLIPFQDLPGQSWLLWLGRVLCLGLFVFMATTSYKIWQLVRNASIRIEITMDRKNHLITFNYFHLFRPSTSVQFTSQAVSKVVVNRMEWPGTTIKYWWVWLYTRDGGRKSVDGCHNKEPMSCLGADLAHVLTVPLEEMH